MKYTVTIRSTSLPWSLLMLYMCLLGLSSSLYAEVYQWTDDQGVIHYSDTPVNKEAKKLKIEPVPTTSTQHSKTKKDKATSSDDAAESKQREDLTEELIKAREKREAEREKKEKQVEKELVQCQEEKTKMELMENELNHLDEKLKTKSREERKKSVEIIKKRDLQVRMERQKQIIHELCY